MVTGAIKDTSAPSNTILTDVLFYFYPHTAHCRAKKVPIIIRRYLPDGSYEDWSVEELIIE